MRAEIEVGVEVEVEETGRRSRTHREAALKVLPGLGRWLWLRYPGGVVCAASHIHCCWSGCCCRGDSDDHRGLGMLWGGLAVEDVVWFWKCWMLDSII